MTWEKVDQWHISSSKHIISKSLNVPKPYTLYLKATKVLIGCYETAELAKEAANNGDTRIN